MTILVFGLTGQVANELALRVPPGPPESRSDSYSAKTLFVLRFGRFSGVVRTMFNFSRSCNRTVRSSIASDSRSRHLCSGWALIIQHCQLRNNTPVEVLGAVLNGTEKAIAYQFCACVMVNDFAKGRRGDTFSRRTKLGHNWPEPKT